MCNFLPKIPEFSLYMYFIKRGHLSRFSSIKRECAPRQYDTVHIPARIPHSNFRKSGPHTKDEEASAAGCECGVGRGGEGGRRAAGSATRGFLIRAGSTPSFAANFGVFLTKSECAALGPKWGRAAGRAVAACGFRCPTFVVP